MPDTVQGGVPRTQPWRKHFHVTIIGAGLVGLVTAIFLSKAGYSVTLLERETELREIGAGVQLPVTHNKVLRELQLLDAVKRFAFMTHNIVLHKYDSGRVLYTMSLEDVHETYESSHMIIHRVDLRKVFANAAVDEGAVLQFGAEINFSKSRLAEGVIVFEDGKSLESDLILGADGEHSRCREALLGHEDRPHHNGRVVNRVGIEWPLIESDPELTRLFDKDTPCIRTWLGPRCQIVAYPLHGQMNFIFNRPMDKLETFFGPRPVDMDELQDFVRDWDPRIQKLVSLGKGYLMWMTFETSILKEWVEPGGKFALIGDAAHSMVSYLAHGAAMGVEDASVLGNLMARASSPSQIPDTLKIYHRLRQPRTEMVKRASSRMGDIWHMADGPLCDERDRRLAEEVPTAGFPNMLSDPYFQQWLWSYDPQKVAHEAWQKHFGATQTARSIP